MTMGYTPEGYPMTMTYDAENRMKTAEYTDSNSIIHRTEYTYSGDSFLAEMKKFENGSIGNDIRYVRGGFCHAGKTIAIQSPVNTSGARILAVALADC
jgi:hypothetical protein